MADSICLERIFDFAMLFQMAIENSDREGLQKERLI